ncbi:dethiobiotin synthase [Nocardioides daeguensis]|uniref:ATP-dependent dethiobiotin synthetase BioD n=1 Tax=Nocardioides daeguensis TaxID=908359 RepID=A0ABP6WIN6_9ACTN|nr:dethiobiotin synthase [Nocardioides daeguensis]MBV6729157.1 dethiobiotin synthase [Nocardioides daeguensis]MCR1774839.1 dethiobiotin synthase [Nocardioides daeguensis]
MTGPGTRVVVVTGTDTGVGKTVATAAIAARAIAAGQRVLVVKPVQTGVGGSDPDPHDTATVGHLSGAEVLELVALDEPLAPDTAARRQGVAIPTVREHVARIREQLASYDLVVVEGAGGLLVRLDTEGGTILDLARDLTFALMRADGSPVEVVVVCRAGLGTLNHTELTTTALRAVQVEPAGLVIGAWPAEPGVAATCNRTDLARLTGVPVVAVIPDGAGSLPPSEFQAGVPTWFA